MINTTDSKMSICYRRPELLLFFNNNTVKFYFPGTYYHNQTFSPVPFLRFFTDVPVITTENALFYSTSTAIVIRHQKMTSSLLADSTQPWMNIGQISFMELINRNERKQNQKQDRFDFTVYVTKYKQQKIINLKLNKLLKKP